MGEFVRLEVEGAVGTIRLDRPKMNAINGQLRAELHEVAVQARERDDVRAVVVYGGERVFAAGADIAEMAQMSFVQMQSWGTGLQEALKVVARLPKPVVAAITGYALGGGFELALACDMRVLGERAKVGLPEITLGIIPGAGGTQRLTRLVGPAKAKDLVFSGRHVAAKQAVDDGLELDLDSALRLETALFTALFATEDQATGMHSFLDNGPGKAVFSGR